MNSKGIGQFIQSKWQAFRAWQENPIRYRMDLTEHVCNCCGHRFIGNYCPVCSQPTGQGRITWSSIWQGIGQLWGVESKSAIYTLWQLLWRPGYLVRDFISGKRQVSYPPVKLLVILAALFALVHYFFPVPDPAPSDSGVRYVDLVFDWMNRHQNIGELLTGCFFILPTWWLFRRAPRYPDHTIPEGFFLQVYIAILAYITQAPFAVSHPLPILLSTAYSYATYKQLFGYGYWQTLWRWTVCTVLSLVALLTVVLVAVLIGMLYQ